MVLQKSTPKVIFVNLHGLQRRYHNKLVLTSDKLLRFMPLRGVRVMILTMETTLATTARLMVG